MLRCPAFWAFVFASVTRNVIELGWIYMIREVCEAMLAGSDELAVSAAAVNAVVNQVLLARGLSSGLGTLAGGYCNDRFGATQLIPRPHPQQAEGHMRVRPCAAACGPFSPKRRESDRRSGKQAG